MWGCYITWQFGFIKYAFIHSKYLCEILKPAHIKYHYILEENKEQIINKGGVDILMLLLRDTKDIIVKRAIVTALSNIVDRMFIILIFSQRY